MLKKYSSLFSSLLKIKSFLNFTILSVILFFLFLLYFSSDLHLFLNRTHFFASLYAEETNSKEQDLYFEEQRRKKQNQLLQSYKEKNRKFNITSLGLNPSKQTIDSVLTLCGWIDCTDEELKKALRLFKKEKSKQENKIPNEPEMYQLNDFTFSWDKFYRYKNDEKNQFLLEQLDKKKNPRTGLFYNRTPKWLKIFGETSIEFKYGLAKTLSKKDELKDSIYPETSQLTQGPQFNADLKVRIKGKLGKKITVDIDFNKKESVQKSQFKVSYKATRKREVIQKITLGDIPLKLGKSEFAVFEQQPTKTIGLETKFGRGKLKFHAIGTLTKGEKAVDRFTGKNKASNVSIEEYKYTQRRYYQLEPFLAYDGLTSPPTIDANSYDRNHANRLVTLTSVPKVSADIFVPYIVNIDFDSLEIFKDDRITSNDNSLSAETKIVNGNDLGNYHKLVLGKDYTFSPKTGRISFLQTLKLADKIFVRYTRDNGSVTTSDPSARIVSTSSGQKIEVFIKWEESLNEDIASDGSEGVIKIPDGSGVNGSGNINYDIYEIRGIYSLESQNINEAGFQLDLLNNTNTSISDFNSLGSYITDYKEGKIYFSLREPFKNLKKPDGTFYIPNISTDSTLELSKLYNENLSSSIQDLSTYHFRADFSHQVNSFKLSHFNIIKDSVVVKINNIIIPAEEASKVYYVDPYSGWFYFMPNSNYPINEETTKIEISYEYLPFFGSNDGFITGVRADYKATRDIQLGATVLYNGQFEPVEAPIIGKEPISRFVFESDIHVKFNEDRITRMVNTLPFTDFDLLPLKVEASGEIAASVYNPNTFGYALIDDMESAAETIDDVSLYYANWILSSPPPSVNTNQCSRAPLKFKYYKHPDPSENYGWLDFASGYPESDTAYYPEYSILAGPYNVGEGHLSSSQLNTSIAERQFSLTMDFDFSKVSTVGNKYASIITRKHSPTGKDYSNITYLEFYAKVQDTSNLDSGVRLRFDIGYMNEDSDGDSILDTEDIGLDGVNGDTNNNGIKDVSEIWDDGERNNILDQVRDGVSEDVGYTFDPPLCSDQDTVVGAGPNIPGYPITQGNGALTSEDLDQDGKLTTTENVVTIDENNLTYVSFDKNSNLLKPNEDWKLVRIIINHSGLNEDQKIAIRTVKSIRMYVVPEAGSENGTGKVLVDSIRFGGSSWRNIKGKLATVGAIDTEIDPNIFYVTSINNHDSKEEYEADSFLIKERDTYETLHGKKTNTEFNYTKESTLKLSYQMKDSNNGDEYERVYTSRVFPRNMDLRFYKTMNVWVNYKNPTTDDYFLFRIGSSDVDYVEFTSQIDKTGWQRLEFNIQDAIRNTSVKKVGSPNFKEINTLTVGIINTKNPTTIKRVIWVNEIYVSEPQMQQDSAYKYEVLMQITKPLFKTKSGIPILSGITAKYKRRKKSLRFSSIGQAFNNTLEDKQEFQFSTKVLPGWNSTYSFVENKTETDPDDFTEQVTLQGNTQIREHNTTQTFQTKYKSLPKISFSYNQREYRNQHSQFYDDIDIDDASITTNQKTYSPSIKIAEQFPEILGVRVKYNLDSSLKFFESNIVTEKKFNDEHEEKELQLEKEQSNNLKNSLKIMIGHFSIEPKYETKTTQLIEKNFSDSNIKEPFSGSFFLPFDSSNETARIRQRLTAYELNSIYKDLWIISPAVKMTAKYQEDLFIDNELTFENGGDSIFFYESDQYQRLKNPKTYGSFQLSVPFNFQKISKKFRFIHSFAPTFKREILLSEESVPYTIGNSIYDDSLGLQRTMPSILERTFNLIEYPFWYYFKSSNSNDFSNAREYVQKNQFDLLDEAQYDSLLLSAQEKYNSKLQLKESAGLNIRWNFYKPMILTTNASIGQQVERVALGNMVTHIANWSGKVKQEYNLMKMLNFWFWKDKTNSSKLLLNVDYKKNLQISQNLYSQKIAGETMFNFKWYNRKKRILEGIQFSFKYEKDASDYEQFITAGESELDDYIALNIPDQPYAGLKKDAIKIKGKIGFFTEILWLKYTLQNWTGIKLRKNPKYTASLSSEFRRYDYSDSTLLTSNAKDIYRLEQKLDANLHSNVNTAFYLLNGWEVNRDAGTNQIKQHLYFLEISIKAKILF